MMTTAPASDLDRAMALLAQDKPEEAAKLSAKVAGAPVRVSQATPAKPGSSPPPAHRP